jgi:hypothetical protein
VYSFSSHLQPDIYIGFSPGPSFEVHCPPKHLSACRPYILHILCRSCLFLPPNSWAPPCMHATSLHAFNLFIFHPLPFSMQSVYSPLCMQFIIYTLPAIFLPSPSCIYFSQAVNPQQPEPVFVNLLGSPGIDSQPGGPVRQPYLLYLPAMLHRLAESNPRNRFLVSLNFYKYALCILVHALSCQQFSCLPCLPCIHRVICFTI